MSLETTTEVAETHYSAFFCKAADSGAAPEEGAGAGKLLRRTNPANPTETVYTLECGTAAHVEQAVAAATAARRLWAGLGALERNRILRAGLTAVMEQQDRIANLLMRETGRPMPFCGMEMGMLPGYFDTAMAQALTVRGDCNRSFTPGELTLVTHQPVGVTACILPWNWPVMLLAQKLAPALAAGNVVIVKPSEYTVGAVSEVLRIFMSVEGFPVGAVSVLNGTGREVGEALVSHNAVRLVSFTGSTRGGKAVQRAAAGNLKRVLLECGGKSAAVVFDDADVDAVLANPGFVLMSGILHAGQVCATASRLLVQEGIYDTFVEKLRKVFTDVVAVGDPSDPALWAKMPLCYGAITNETQVSSIMAYIESGKAEGARLVCGGTRKTVGGGGDDADSSAAGGGGSGGGGGLYIAPTIFADVKPNMKIFKEEIFGPVLCVAPFKNMDEALRVANDSEYGLQAYVWTQDLNRALAFADGVEAGTVSINTGAPPKANQPFGGVKQSGSGRENGLEGMLEWMEVKTIVVPFPTANL